MLSAVTRPVDHDSYDIALKDFAENRDETLLAGAVARPDPSDDDRPAAFERGFPVQVVRHQGELTGTIAAEADEEHQFHGVPPRVTQLDVRDGESRPVGRIELRAVVEAMTAAARGPHAPERPNALQQPVSSVPTRSDAVPAPSRTVPLAGLVFAASGGQLNSHHGAVLAGGGPAATSGDRANTPEAEPSEPPPPPAVLDPIEPEVLVGMPFAGVLPVDRAGVRNAARTFLKHIAGLAPDWAEQIHGPSIRWIAAGALLAGGVSYALAVHRERLSAARPRRTRAQPPED